MNLLQEMTNEVRSGDVGKYKGKVIVVLRKTKNYFKIMNIKNRKKRKIRINSDKLKFPADYFTNRKKNTEECSKFLTCVLYEKNIVVLFLFFRKQERKFANEELAKNGKKPIFVED